MNKNIFWIVSVFLISLTIFTVQKDFNLISQLIIGFVLIAFVTINWKIVISQEDVLKDKADYTIVIIGLLFMLLSQAFKKYDLILLLLCILTSFIRIILIKRSPKKIKS